MTPEYWTIAILIALSATQYLVLGAERRKAAEALRVEHERAEAALNKLAAVDVRDAHYPALMAASEMLNRVTYGMKQRLETSPQSPFGKYTGMYPHERFDDLILFLMFDEQPERFRSSGLAGRSQ